MVLFGIKRLNDSSITFASQGKKGIRTIYEVRLMVKPLLPMPPAFFAPVHAIVGCRHY